MSSGGGGGKRKPKHEEHEEHANHERWLVSYADMMTLLFVLFVVLFAMSSVDQKKFAELAAGLAEGFGAESAAFQGRAAPLDGAANTADIVQIDPGSNPRLVAQRLRSLLPPDAAKAAEAASGKKAG